MSARTATASPGTATGGVRTGATLMAVAAAGFIGYAVLFLVRNFTGGFLELGIGAGEVSVGKDQIQQFSPSLHHYISHLHIALSGFIAATGLAVLLLAVFGVRAGQAWAWVAAVAAPVLGWASRCPPTTRGTSTPWVTSGSSTWQCWCSSPARCCPARACWTPEQRDRPVGDGPPGSSPGHGSRDPR
jgi:hypothetical protein